MIPKVIYTTWISENPIPQKFEKYIASWKRVMPDYEIRIITLENVKRGIFVNEAIDIKNYALAGHYARVEELYLNGGVYFDIDVEAINSFDPLLGFQMVLGMEDNNWINNAVIVAEKGHAYLKECMDYMDAFPFDSEKIELATGPIMFTNLMRKRGWTNGRAGIFTTSPLNPLSKGEGAVTVLSPEHFYPYRYDKVFTKECITYKTFAVHHWAFTWNPRVSVIIPCYKQAEFLPDAIESVLQQTYKDVEIIVVNDGSPDNTSEVAKRYPKVKLIEQENKGLSAARNAGIRAATGGWILTLDADDKIHPDFLKKTVGVNDIVSTRLETFGAFKASWKSVLKHPTHRDLLRQNYLNCCSLFKKDVWTVVGGYDERMRDGYEDWEFWIRATGAGFNITCIEEVLFYYRKHATKSMFDHARNNHNTIIEYMREKHPVNGFKLI